METVTEVDLSPVIKLSRDIKSAAIVLSDTEARFLVDAYYIMQENRKRSFNQVRALGESEEPNQVIQWLADQSSTLEKQIKNALDVYSMSSEVGQWARSVLGIGPVLAAGLLAHIDIERAPTAGHIWAYAGLDPTKSWKKGKKRPWNAALKVLCWKIGESFVKVSSREKDFYGKIYRERKEYEAAKNAAGDYKEQAARKLEKFDIGKDTAAYACYIKGFLPSGHLDARAKRYATKMFLSHLHHVWYEKYYGKKPPLPFAIAHLDHVHLIAVPGI